MLKGTPWSHFRALWSSCGSLWRPGECFGPPFGPLLDHLGPLWWSWRGSWMQFWSLWLIFDDLSLILWSSWYLWLDWCLVCGLVVLEGSGDSFLVIFLGVWWYVLCCLLFIWICCAWFSQSLSQWVCHSVSLSVSEWSSESVSEWEIEWVSERVSD